MAWLLFVVLLIILSVLTFVYMKNTTATAIIVPIGIVVALAAAMIMFRR